MSGLQISLAILGLLVLAAVMLHGAWTARKSRPRQALPELRQPTAGEPPHPAPQDGANPDRLEPRFDRQTAGEDSLPALTRMNTPERRPGLDVLIDSVAAIAVESLVSGDAALVAMPGSYRVGSKPFAIEGLNTTSGSWEFPVAGERYRAFQAGVQLANRNGALNQIEYSEFVIKAQAFADAIGAEAEFPDMLDEVARARELDQFASTHDAQLSFTLRANRTAWSPGYVQQCAAHLGFIPGAIPGRLVLPASEAGQAPMIGLAFDTQAALAEEPQHAALAAITLSLDVPQVGRDEQPFVRMCECAMALAESMEGSIIDDNDNPIAAEAMEVIYADLEQLYDRLDEQELSAGSVLARRVFS